MKIESFHEFCRRQGCAYVVAGTQLSPRTGEDVNRCIFQNGAMSDGATHYDPPPGPHDLLRAKHEYVKVKLKQETKDFDAYRNACLEQAALHARYPNLPPAPGDAPAQLRAGAERILKLREELAALTEALIDPKERARQRIQRELAEEQQARIAARLAEIRAIEI